MNDSLMFVSFNWKYIGVYIYIYMYTDARKCLYHFVDLSNGYLMMIASVWAAFSKQRSAEKLWMEEIQHHWGWVKRGIDYLLSFRCCEKLRGPMVGSFPE